MFGQALVNHRAMGVPQWHGRWFCDEARPNNFDKAQALFSRKLKDFGNVGIAHNCYPTTVDSSALTQS